ncbi:hypothetical protein P7K49_032500 [Saguinus oedipus]|uniref:Uncharacterized protein n=1 Tax=Saguinus oedipus TaxID=9490 RepID=A0ABQ9TYF1_SAGOE|nr:hypothetical protein P7K49_032500 [Saguinus oedipus]
MSGLPFKAAVMEGVCFTLHTAVTDSRTQPGRQGAHGASVPVSGLCGRLHSTPPSGDQPCSASQTPPTSCTPKTMPPESRRHMCFEGPSHTGGQGMVAGRRGGSDDL